MTQLELPMDRRNANPIDTLKGSHGESLHATALSPYP